MKLWDFCRVPTSLTGSNSFPTWRCFNKCKSADVTEYLCSLNVLWPRAIARRIVGNRTHTHVRKLVSGHSNLQKFKMADTWLIILLCYLAFIVIFMAIPASLGFSFGIRNLYLGTLLKIFEVCHTGAVVNGLLCCRYLRQRRYERVVRTC